MVDKSETAKQKLLERARIILRTRRHCARREVGFNGQQPDRLPHHSRLGD